jgi:hypothetical protein
MQPELELKAYASTQPRPTMKKGEISEKNLRALESIKEIIEVEEEKNVTLDQTLSRVLSHYRRYVPFQTH